MPSTMGNVTVAFGVLSHAGTLTLTVVADPERCTDLPVLVEALRRRGRPREPDALVGHPHPRPQPLQ
jgi:hypothetical protein